MHILEANGLSWRRHAVYLRQRPLSHRPQPGASGLADDNQRERCTECHCLRPDQPDRHLPRGDQQLHAHRRQQLRGAHAGHAPLVDTSLIMADEVQNYITANSPINHGVEGRITRLQARLLFVVKGAEIGSPTPMYRGN